MDILTVAYVSLKDKIFIISHKASYPAIHKYNTAASIAAFCSMRNKKLPSLLSSRARITNHSPKGLRRNSCENL
jgi:hypothetical protein